MAEAGLHKMVRLNHFDIAEKQIIHNLSKEWYITNGGGQFKLGATSLYKYFIMRPTEIYKEMFNIEKDIVTIFSSYEDFQSRTLDGFDFVQKKYEKLRIEKICGILISKDKDIKQKLKNLLKNEKESLVIIPFTYDELYNLYDEYIIKNRFRFEFYTRDLFAFESPLKKDIFFFGRHDLIHDLVNRHLSNENSGIFGLRKTGKTSAIFAIQRYLEKADSGSIFIDCQNPSFHRKRWFKSLEYLIDETINQLKIKNFKRNENYTQDDASRQFENDLLKIKTIIKKKRILFIFDEIEHITYKLSPSEHWCQENDFIFFWQSMRSIFQKNNKLLTYLIVGTNPNCIETATINKKDNPIFSQFKPQFIPRFDVHKTKEMLEKLGGYMGIKFDEIIFGLINEDFGGHPFLIRHLCSIINIKAPTKRPITVDKGLYLHAKKIFVEENTRYFDMILNVLEEHYSEEYEMLKCLARDDFRAFNEGAKNSLSTVNHLIGYGIIENKNNNFSFRIDAIKEYLLSKEKYKKLYLTKEEKQKEISERRNNIEPIIRKLIKNQLKINFGDEAKEKLLISFPKERRLKMKGHDFEDLLNANKNEIYLSDLKNIINKYWEIFRNIFNNNLPDFNKNLECINTCRIDAHAKDISEDEMQYFRICISKIENQINPYI